jgi:hypothetical protein
MLAASSRRDRRNDRANRVRACLSSLTAEGLSFALAGVPSLEIEAGRLTGDPLLLDLPRLLFAWRYPDQVSPRREIALAVASG